MTVEQDLSQNGRRAGQIGAETRSRRADRGRRVVVDLPCPVAVSLAEIEVVEAYLGPEINAILRGIWPKMTPNHGSK